MATHTSLVPLSYLEHTPGPLGAVFCTDPPTSASQPMSLKCLLRNLQLSTSECT